MTIFEAMDKIYKNKSLMARSEEFDEILKYSELMDRFIVVDDDGYTHPTNPAQDPYLGMNWTIVPKKVDFMTAVKSGKRIKRFNKHYSQDFKTLRDLLEELLEDCSNQGIRDEFLSSDWEIEE